MIAIRRDMLNDYGDEEAIVDEAITDYHSSVERIKLQISTGGIVAAMRRARRTASGGNNKITIHLLRRANIQSRNNKVAELIAVIGTRWCSEEYPAWLGKIAASGRLACCGLQGCKLQENTATLGRRCNPPTD
jgi:hypothetical protein